MDMTFSLTRDVDYFPPLQCTGNFASKYNTSMILIMHIYLYLVIFIGRFIFFNAIDQICVVIKCMLYHYLRHSS
jgi:hypothetical protein